MFSIITTVPLMMIPKSMAPIESRFAATSWACRKKKAERNRNGNDDSSTKTDEEEDEHDHDEDHASEQIIFDCVFGQLNQFIAIIIGMNFDVRRQNLPVQLVGFRL